MMRSRGVAEPEDIRTDFTQDGLSCDCANPGTVMFHKYHTMEPFNLKNNAELVLFALNRHLISS